MAKKTLKIAQHAAETIVWIVTITVVGVMAAVIVLIATAAEKYRRKSTMT